MTMRSIKSLVLVFALLSESLLGFVRPDFFQREVPLELAGRGSKTRAVGLAPLSSFKLGQIFYKSLKKGAVDLQIPGGRPLALSGMPKVPKVSKIFKVESERIAVAQLENVVLEETAVSVPVPKVAEAFVWNLKSRLTFRRKNQDRYFPGKLIQSYQEKDSLFVTVFPIQVDLLTGKVLKVASADIKVSYTEPDRFASMSTRDLLINPSLIITSSKMQKAAEILKNYHESKLGIKTTVVTVEEIDKNEEAISEESLPMGYKTQEQRDNFVKPFDSQKKTGYNYELARKISNYLQSRMEEPSALKYVTILGGAGDVPPSYYYAYNTDVGRNFTPTDACYGANKKCLEPKVAVGRLPLSNEDEVKSYIEKVDAWIKFSNESSEELTLFGGKAFPGSEVYVGELSALTTIQDMKSDWSGVRKNFKTQKKYSKAKMLEWFRGEAETPFSYHVDHGQGNELFVNSDSITSKDIAALVPSPRFRPSLMVSISCSNGAFDEALTNESIYVDNFKGELSVGTNLVKSKAGVVAYLGSARPATGMPIYQIDEFGNLDLTGSNYGLQILESFFHKYGVLRQGRLGDFSLKALQAFVFENGNNLEMDQNAWSYFITELLGDPVIPLPNRSKHDEGFALGRSILKLDNSAGFGFPILHSKEISSDTFPLSLVQAVEASLFKVLEDDNGRYTGEELIAAQKINVSEVSQFSLGPQKNLTDGTYFLRLENAVGVPRERQIYFKVD